MSTGPEVVGVSITNLSRSSVHQEEGTGSERHSFSLRHESPSLSTDGIGSSVTTVLIRFLDRRSFEVGRREESPVEFRMETQRMSVQSGDTKSTLARGPGSPFKSEIYREYLDSFRPPRPSFVSFLDFYKSRQKHHYRYRATSDSFRLILERWAIKVSRPERLALTVEWKSEIFGP